ncbi:TonB-dependent receptor [Candidatus Methylospira mobilis]|uniref:TonB-dependent receptor n=1 Tax=Candidatus Methylospira mobilis TaxID=1808979 RepID=A0A5Q0BFW7_9GAMM|nr:TonB-dependent receptor [Candidatus Methylospira mobilis]QFY42710.1 TonB-dependent receptor [Candidatus Methylospira mobilis]
MKRTKSKKRNMRAKRSDRSLLTAWVAAYLSLTSATALAEKAGESSTAAPVPQNATQGAATPEDGFAAYDWDGDGNISKSEWKRGPKPGTPANEITAVGDLDKKQPDPNAVPTGEGEGKANYEAQERAAELSESNPNQLGEVEVTSQKRKQSEQKVPTALTVLNGQRIIDQGIGRSAGDVLNFVPNGSAGTQFHGRPRWFIRGVGTGNQQLDLANPIGFYQDQVYMGNSTATGIPLFDLERTEVMSGPQGTLWGKNTTGGAIDVVSRKPKLTEDQEGYAKLSYGTYNDAIAEGAYGARLYDNVAVRGAFHYENQDGRFNTWNPVNNSETGQMQGGFHDAMFRVSGLAKITDDLEVLANVHYRDYYTQGGVTTTGTSMPGTAGTVLYKDPLTGYTNTPSTNSEIISAGKLLPLTNNQINQTGAMLNLTQKFDDYTLTGITGYENWKSQLYGSAPNPQSSEQVTQEIRLASPGNKDFWNWQNGVFYSYENISSNTYTGTTPCGVGLTTTQIAAQPNGLGCLSSLGQQSYSNQNFSHNDQSAAIFTSNTFNITDDILATAGFRYTYENKNVNMSRQQAVAPANGTLNYNDAATLNGVVGNGAVSSNPLFYNPNVWWQSVNPSYLPTQVVYSPAAAAANPTASNFVGQNSVSWNMITYDVTPQWNITKDAMVYFKYAKGMKSGGFNTSAAQLSVFNTLIKPETLYDYEVGAKTAWFDGRLKANTTLFYYSYLNDQVNVTAVPISTFPNNQSGYIYNVNKAHSEGAEFQVEALPIQDLHLIGNIGLLDTRFDDVGNINQNGVPLTSQILQGNQMVRSPHFNSFLQADYRLPLDIDYVHFIASGDWRYQSQQYYYVNYQFPSNPTTPYGATIQQPGYSMVNFRFTVASNDEKYSLTAYMLNALDAQYLNHSSLPAASTLNGAGLIYGQPRTVGLQLNVRYW